VTEDDYVGAGRVKYKVAGAAMRQALARATQAKVSPFSRSVLDAVLVLLVSYSKISDTTTVRQIARLVYGRDELHGRERERVSQALRSLEALGIVQVVRGGVGRYARLIVSLPMDTTDVADDDDSMATSSVADESRADDSMATVGGFNGHSSGASMATAGVAHLEGSTEESPYRGQEIALQRDAIATRLVDNIESVSYDEWLEYVNKLRGENVADSIIDAAAGQTISGVESGHVHSPRGYFLTTARDWYKQRAGREPDIGEWCQLVGTARPFDAQAARGRAAAEVA
jgi:hypothetical protein